MTDDPQSQRILSPKERRQRNRQEVISAILDAARTVMREEGVAALNLNEVARRVGMRTPSLYEYFPSKLALYEALFVAGMRQFREEVEQGIAAYGTGWEGMQFALTHHMEFAHRYPEMYQLLFERPVPGFVPSAEGLVEVNRLVEVSVQAIASAVEAGVVNSNLSVEQTHNLFLALMHGMTALHRANEPELPPGEGRFGSLIPAAMQLLRQAWGHSGKA